MLENGQIRVYTGDGKGKTTAALGLACMAISRNLRVFMVQFLKRPNTSGEYFAAEAISPLFTIKPMGRGGFIGRRQLEPEDRDAGQRGLEKAREAMLGGDYAMIILDESNVAVHYGVIDLKQLLDFMAAKPENVVLVITGRNAHPDVIDLADVVVEMKKIKHYFDDGVKPIKGIDY
jgi:cob(I)alamin adenosyltransferase